MDCITGYWYCAILAYFLREIVPSAVSSNDSL